jgi:hypothetical protein
MATEAKRGCGYRKVHGTYLVSGALEKGCDRLPFELVVCPCCGEGIKQARGFKWIDPIKLFGTHLGCSDGPGCPMCSPSNVFTKRVQDEIVNVKAGLIWVGEKFYTTGEFLTEASMLGVSRRIAGLPNDFVIGETYVFLAHAKSCCHWDREAVDETSGQKGALVYTPGIFCAFRPTRVEYIVKQSEYETYLRGRNILASIDDDQDATLKDILSDIDYKIYKSLADRVKRGMTLVPVPDDDKDHQ